MLFSLQGVRIFGKATVLQFFFSPATDSLSGASSFSFSKATDCTSAALRGGREMIANQVLSKSYSGIKEDREMIANQVLSKKDPSKQQKLIAGSKKIER